MERSRFIRHGAGFVGAALAVGTTVARARAATPLEVAYAGSMSALMEGRIKPLAERELQLEMRGRAQGASGLAALIVGGSIRPDVFVSITPGPMRAVLRAGKADQATPIARTAVVLAYAAGNPFAPTIIAAARGAVPWWRVLEQPGLRFGRTDPRTDPQGRNIIFALQLAALEAKRPELVAAVLGDTENPRQIFEEPTLPARVQSGQLDVAAAYRVQPAAFGLSALALPASDDLSDDRRAAWYRRASLTIDGVTSHPEPLVYYAAVLNDAPNPPAARAFVTLLRSREGQAIFRASSYDSPAGAAALRR